MTSPTNESNSLPKQSQEDQHLESQTVVATAVLETLPAVDSWSNSENRESEEKMVTNDNNGNDGTSNDQGNVVVNTTQILTDGASTAATVEVTEEEPKVVDQLVIATAINHSQDYVITKMHEKLSAECKFVPDEFTGRLEFKDHFEGMKKKVGELIPLLSTALADFSILLKNVVDIGENCQLAIDDASEREGKDGKAACRNALNELNAKLDQTTKKISTMQERIRGVAGAHPENYRDSSATSSQFHCQNQRQFDSDNASDSSVNSSDERMNLLRLERKIKFRTSHSRQVCNSYKYCLGPVGEDNFKGKKCHICKRWHHTVCAKEVTKAGRLTCVLCFKEEDFKNRDYNPREFDFWKSRRNQFNEIAMTHVPPKGILPFDCLQCLPNQNTADFNAALYQKTGYNDFLETIRAEKEGYDKLLFVTRNEHGLPASDIVISEYRRLYQQEKKKK